MVKPTTTDTLRLMYLFDPLCGWCYGVSPTLRQLAALEDFVLEVAPSGLFSGEGARPMDEAFADYAWANDQRIARLTGQRFTPEYRRKVLGDRTGFLDSGPATLALTAVALTAPARELDVLQTIQEARYVEGRDVTDLTALANLLRDLDLSGAVERITALDEGLLSANRTRVSSARSQMQQFGANGVPALIVAGGTAPRLLGATALFTRVEDLVARLQAMRAQPRAVN